VNTGVEFTSNVSVGPPDGVKEPTITAACAAGATARPNIANAYRIVFMEFNPCIRLSTATAELLLTQAGYCVQAKSDKQGGKLA
jgi:hypothetical protein